jgi:hypothetical protein
MSGTMSVLLNTYIIVFIGVLVAVGLQLGEEPLGLGPASQAARRAAAEVARGLGHSGALLQQVLRQPHVAAPRRYVQGRPSR